MIDIVLTSVNFYTYSLLFIGDGVLTYLTRSAQVFLIVALVIAIGGYYFNYYPVFFPVVLALFVVLMLADKGIAKRSM